MRLEFQNICGLTTNLDDVANFLDILVLSETNLPFNMSGYLPLCSKDPDRYMHELGIYIHDTLCLTRESKLESDD